MVVTQGREEMHYESATALGAPIVGDATRFQVTVAALLMVVDGSCC